MAIDFLMKLLRAPGPSGDEVLPAKVFRDEAKKFADDVTTDVRGNVFATLNGNSQRVLLAGHLDEIGVMVTHIDSDGYLYFGAVGGWDSQVLVGQRIRLLGKTGQLVGVVGKKAIHLQTPDMRDKVTKLEDMWIDIGAKNADEAKALVRVGSTGVIDGEPIELPNGRIASRSLDNRISAYVVMEALRLLHKKRPKVTVSAVGTAQEEIGLLGARTATFGFNPVAGIAVDVTHATDFPSNDKRQHGDVKLGGGPVLHRGSANSPVVFDMLVDIAEREKIPYQLASTPRGTGTDGDAMHISRAGVATGVVSIPNRYMHSPSEMVELSDADNAAKLVAAFVRSITPKTSFIPE